MTDLTLIESDVFDELLEKAITLDVMLENNLMRNTFVGWNFNTEVATRKANFLAKYVTIPVNLDETIADKLEEMMDHDK